MDNELFDKMWKEFLQNLKDAPDDTYGEGPIDDQMNDEMLAND